MGLSFMVSYKMAKSIRESQARKKLVNEINEAGRMTQKVYGENLDSLGKVDQVRLSQTITTLERARSFILNIQE